MSDEPEAERRLEVLRMVHARSLSHAERNVLGRMQGKYRLELNVGPDGSYSMKLERPGEPAEYYTVGR